MTAAPLPKKFFSLFKKGTKASALFESATTLSAHQADALLGPNSSGSHGSLQEIIQTWGSNTNVQFPPHIESAAAEHNQVKADDLLDLRFTLASEQVVSFTEVIDWQFDPTPDPSRRWAKALNRHYWLVALARAYQETSDEKYADFVGKQLIHWIQQNPPPPEKDEKNVAWTLMGAGIRAMVWPDVLRIFSSSESFQNTAAPLILLSIHDHASFLASHQTHLNHLLREANGLLHIALRFPEFLAADEWQRIAVSRLENEIDIQIQDDGSHIELSLAYQWLVAEELESTRRICKLSQNLSSFEDKVVRALTSLYDCLGAVATPASTWPQIKEGFYPPQERLRTQLLEASQRTENDHLEWIATRGTGGSPTEQTCRFLPYSGTAVFRSDWSTKASYLIFQNGAFGGPHGHEDALGIELWAGGTAFLVDPGTSSYNINDPFRRYFTSSNAHNTVTVNGMSQVRRWSQRQWWNRKANSEFQFSSRGDDLHWVTGSYKGRYADYKSMRGRFSKALKGITHRRKIIFVRNRYWLLIDDLAASKPSVFERLFQCARDINVLETSQGVQLVNDDSDQSLYVSSLDATNITISSGQVDPIAGWVCDGTRNAHYPAPQLSMASALCKQARLITLLMPVDRNQPEPNISIGQQGATLDTARVSYHANGTATTDLVILGPKGSPPWLD